MPDPTINLIHEDDRPYRDRGPWVAGRSYAAGESVTEGGQRYISSIGYHVSRVFANDLAAGFWKLSTDVLFSGGASVGAPSPALSPQIIFGSALDDANVLTAFNALNYDLPATSTTTVIFNHLGTEAYLYLGPRGNPAVATSPTQLISIGTTPGTDGTVLNSLTPHGIDLSAAPYMAAVYFDTADGTVKLADNSDPLTAAEAVAVAVLSPTQVRVKYAGSHTTAPLNGIAVGEHRVLGTAGQLVVPDSGTVSQPILVGTGLDTVEIRLLRPLEAAVLAAGTGPDRYATVADLPAAGTVTSGRIVSVTDGVDRGIYLAAGPHGAPAQAWEQQ
ncbi:MAG: hypothetical protein ACR2RB_08500 [Gammaproteobacteria bacterium]